MTSADDNPVFRNGGISYVRIPAPDPRALGAFYADVFGWTLRGEPDQPSFDDGTGHVIGAFQRDLRVAGNAGVILYVYVHDVDAAVERAVARGAQIVRPVYEEGDLWVAVLRDPAGNIVGAWQSGPRAKQ
jgi:uncharacterized protein